VTVFDAERGAKPAPGKGGFDVPSGGGIRMEAPGSGGYGPVAERDTAAVRRDLLDGYVTPEAARRDYGVDPDALLAESGDD
jgi:N-methylhydantoinase B